MRDCTLKYFLELTQLQFINLSKSLMLTVLHHICGFDYKALLIATDSQYIVCEGI